jgi:hypothetical protein
MAAIPAVSGSRMSPRSRLVLPNLNQVKFQIARWTSVCSPPPSVAKKARNAKMQDKPIAPMVNVAESFRLGRFRSDWMAAAISGKNGINHCCLTNSSMYRASLIYPFKLLISSRSTDR